MTKLVFYVEVNFPKAIHNKETRKINSTVEIKEEMEPQNITHSAIDKVRELLQKIKNS